VLLLWAASRFAPTCEWDTAAADIIVREAGGVVLQAGKLTSNGQHLEDWRVRLVVLLYCTTAWWCAVTIMSIPLTCMCCNQHVWTTGQLYVCKIRVIGTAAVSAPLVVGGGVVGGHGSEGYEP
jgi:hypothetical protein